MRRMAMIYGAKPQGYIVHPLPDPKIQNLLSIHHERLEGFYLDGQRLTSGEEE
jgi:hypothetical protein